VGDGGVMKPPYKLTSLIDKKDTAVAGLMLACDKLIHS
jgi:hypothetical protein